MLNIVGRKTIWFTLSGILVGLAIAAIAVYGFHQSAEFLGGSLWEFKIPANESTLADVQNFFTNTLKIEGATVTYDTTNQSFLARFNIIDEATHEQYLKQAQNQWPSFTELSFSSIGPSVGASLKNNAMIAIGLVL